jgi:hypothetical protein
MPVTVSSVEKSLSKLKIINNRLRTKMDDEKLNALLTYTLETLILDKLSNSESAEKWAKNKSGRRV